MWERAPLDTVPTTLEHKPPSKKHAFTADTRFEVCPFHGNGKHTVWRL